MRSPAGGKPVYLIHTPRFALARFTNGLAYALCARSGGAEFYNAAVQLKEQLRGRCSLLIADRPDIADAIEADGVVLSAQGKSALTC